MAYVKVIIEREGTGQRNVESIHFTRHVSEGKNQRYNFQPLMMSFTNGLVSRHPGKEKRNRTAQQSRQYSPLYGFCTVIWIATQVARLV